MTALLVSSTLAIIPKDVSAGGGGRGGKAQINFVSPEAALEQGLGAYRSGFFQLALPALTYAADSGLFLGQYHLARLYADNASALTDHARAYELYQSIVEQHAASIDVDDDERAPLVGKALTAVATYIYRGIPEIELKPNPERAASFYQEAATFFRDRDAQFELAKLYLAGDGVVEDRKQALGWLTILTQDGHAGAQAFLAELLWRGKIINRDERRALALITVAVEHAPPHDRIWIEQIYQSIFCGIPSDTRQQADGLVASFRHQYAPRSATTSTEGSGDLAVTPARTCANGEALPPVPGRQGNAASQPAPTVRAASPAASVGTAYQGGVVGVGEQNGKR